MPGFPVVGALVLCDPVHCERCSPAASPSPLVGAGLPGPPPVVEVILQDLKGLVPCPPLPGCVLVTCGVMFRLGKHHSDLQVLQALAGGVLPQHRRVLPHGNTTQVKGWGLSSQVPSVVLEAPLGSNGNTLLCFRAAPFTKT